MGLGAGPRGRCGGAGLAQEKAPPRPPAAPPWLRAPRPRAAPALPRARRSAAAREPEGSRGPAGQAARRAAAKATAEAAGRARAHCRGARFGGRGSVQSSLFDGISVYRVYSLISTCFLLLPLLLLRDLLRLLLLFLLRNFAPAVWSATAQPGRDAGRRRAAGRRQPGAVPAAPGGAPRPPRHGPETPAQVTGIPGGRPRAGARWGPGAGRAGGKAFPGLLRGCQILRGPRAPASAAEAAQGTDEWKSLCGKYIRASGSTPCGSFCKLHGDIFPSRGKKQHVPAGAECCPPVSGSPLGPWLDPAGVREGVAE